MKTDLNNLVGFLLNFDFIVLVELIQTKQQNL